MAPFDLNEIQALGQTDFIDFFVDHVLIDLKEAHALERRTVLQGESAEWLDQHNYRLTASNFGKVYFRVQRPSEAMLKNIFEAKDLTNVRAICTSRHTPEGRTLSLKTSTNSKKAAIKRILNMSFVCLWKPSLVLWTQAA